MSNDSEGFNLRSHSVALMVALALSGPLIDAQTPAPAEPLTLEAAFARALTANQTIAAARLSQAVNQAGVGVARELPNPEGRIEYTKETPKEAYTLALPVELGGKRRKRVAIGEATVRTGEAELNRTILDIRGQVRHAYFNQLIAEARVKLLDELQQFATRAHEAAQQRFDAGSAPRLEVLQAQLALAQAENEATVARASAHAASVELNALLGFPLDSTAVLVTTPDSAGTVAVEVATAQAQASNAELAVLDRQIEEASARIALARAMRVPDVTPEAALTRDAEPEFDTGWRAAVSFTLPLFTTHVSGVRVAEATLEQLRTQRDATLARITGEVSSAVALAEAQRQAYLRYRDQVLPQAQEVESMAEDSYRLGQTGIAALLQALQASRDARLQGLLAASSYQDAITEVEHAIGAPIP
ncbi:MAG TPA: TolC family protein [Candidatus Polarisedimenticolia bacterium]|nr:TolC family protein [Candidatus Polarisedimenticolia bacterium]